MMKARAAALSSAGLMIIAGCSGGGHGGGSSLPGTPLATSTAVALANAARVTLSISIPPRQTQSFRRGQKFVPAGTTRKPSYVSPSTYYVSLNAVSGGTSLYSTYFTVAQCAPYGSVYECATNLPTGTFTLYTNLYDSSGYLLSTNLYSNPAPVTVYPNGSAYSNYLYVQTAGVVTTLQTMTPTSCLAAGHQQSIPLYFLDADGNTIVGPLANPMTPTFTAVNGAGLSALSVYAIYNGSPVSINNAVVSDTSLYASPYFFVSGSEGAVNVAATFQNFPIYSDGLSGPSTFTPSAGYAAVGTYVAWGIENAPIYGVYSIAIEQSINQAIVCGNGGVSGIDANIWSYIGAIKDPGNGNPYLVISDTNNNVEVFDAYVAADYARSYMFFQTSAYGNPGPHTEIYQTADFVTGGPFVDFFTSANTTGRVNVMYQGATTGIIQIFDTSNGAITSSSAYNAATGITLSSSTRLSGATSAHSLYYNVPGTPWLYAINTSNNTQNTTMDFSTFTPVSGTPPSGQLYALSPSGSGHTYQFVRGADTGGAYHVCEFDANPGNWSFGIFCANTGSHNSNPASMQFDPGTGNIMWATGSTSTFAFSAYTVPSSWAATFGAGTSIYTLSHNATRVLPGLESVPGVVGFYGGQMASGPCTGSGEITWIRWTGSSWAYLAHMCWPNHYITLTYQ